MAASSFPPNERYVRNAGVKNLYKRGKVYYRIKNGKWESLHTGVKREALCRMRQAIERDIAQKYLEKAGLGGLGEKIARVGKRGE